VFKNINIVEEKRTVVLKDFTICLGELKKLYATTDTDDPPGQISR
jgi:hypothetical protein